MLENRNLGVALIIIGVLANNYVYLHDLIFGKYEEYEDAIVLGPLAGVLIVAALAVTALGLIILLRSQAASSTE